MHQGRIEQISTPRELYNAPKTSFVASFIGQANLFSGHVISDGDDVWFHTVDNIRILTVPSAKVQGEASLIIRPENIFISAEKTDIDNCFPGKIVEKQFLGNMIRYSIQISEHCTLIAQIHPDDDVLPGETVFVNFKREKTTLVGS